MKPFALTFGLLAICVLFLSRCSGAVGLSGEAQQDKSSNDQRLQQPQTDENNLASVETEPLEEPIDLNQRVIPPQVIAGSYLTCNFSDEAETSGRALYGCTANSADGERLDLADVKTQWDIAASAEFDIDAIDASPTDDVENHHKYWSVIAAARAMPLTPTLTVYDAEGYPREIRPKGVVTVQ